MPVRRSQHGHRTCARAVTCDVVQLPHRPVGRHVSQEEIKVERAVVTERVLNRSRRAGLLLAAVIGVALLASACGGPSSSSGSGPSSSGEIAAALSFSKCMRAHGVTNYPDPTQTGSNHITQSFSGDTNSPQFWPPRTPARSCCLAAARPSQFHPASSEPGSSGQHASALTGCPASPIPGSPAAGCRFKARHPNRLSSSSPNRRACP
jgi:hypothetical protein